MAVISINRLLREKGHPKGSVWLVESDEELGRIAAQLALGQWENVVELLRNSGWPEPPAEYAIAGAKRLFLVPDGKPPWHRDGWLFQLISWVAAVEHGKGPVRAPHIIHAHKGLDGLQLLLSPNGKKLKRIIIFEDKATTNPRDVVRDEVWPSFVQLEQGTRDHELVSELSSLLKYAPHLDRRASIDRVMRFKQNRSYRIAITVGAHHATDAGIKQLFKGYKTVVHGRRFRRRAHILEHEDIRAWLATIAEHALDHLRSIDTNRTEAEGELNV